MGYSNDNFWKLDKWDKIGIATLIVFFTIFVVLNTFCFGAQNISLVKFNNAVFSNGTIVSSSRNRVGGYIQCKKGHTYSVNFEGFPGLNYAFTDVLPDFGVSYYGSSYKTSSFEFVADKDFFVCYSGFLDIEDGDINDYVTIVDDTPGGMLGAVTILTNYFSLYSLWGVFVSALPFILLVVLVAFGIYLISHAIKEVSKGRDV